MRSWTEQQSPYTRQRRLWARAG